MPGDSHQTVLRREAVEALQIKPQGHYIDATFGRGGHSAAILGKLGTTGRLLAMDRDYQAIASGREGKLRDDQRLQLLHRPFAEMMEGAHQAGMTEVDGVLFDLGVSSPQLDDGQRGFSFRQDAPLDMRMDTSSGETAAEWLARAEIREITEVLRDYGEERFAFQIAKKIVAARHERPVSTTGMLAALVRETVRTHEVGQDAATRSFQAIRIHINQELQQLALALPQALELIKEGGRLVVISFHSLEDRIVKRFMRHAACPDNLPKSLPVTAAQLPAAQLRLCGAPQRASAEEIRANPRARSAIMRVAEKVAVAHSPLGQG